ncbi:MAG: hypothetical protein D6752_07120, partial [Candidatus Nitrosothermus koennekii]
LLTLLIIPISSYAQSEDLQVIENEYSNKDLGLEFILPDGWNGAQIPLLPSSIDGLLSDIILATPDDIRSYNGTTFILVMAGEVTDEFKGDIANIPEPPNPVKQIINQGCELISANYITIGDLDGIEFESICKEADENGNTITAKNKIIFANQNSPMRFISVLFIAKADEYDSYIQDFDDMIDTLALSGNKVRVDKLPNIEERVMLEEETFVNIKTNSDINDFSFNEEDKSISFNAEGEENTIGIAEVYLDNVLKGPYTVIVDDKPIPFIDNETGVTFIYTHSLHKIKIIGSEVVPEFPITVLPLLAIIIGIMVMISKSNQILKR